MFRRYDCLGYRMNFVRVFFDEFPYGVVALEYPRAFVKELCCLEEWFEWNNDLGAACIFECLYSLFECFAVTDGKTEAVTLSGERFRVKRRLYELEQTLPSDFIKINKSCIANKNRVERFSAAFSGAVDVIFKSGYTDYVSRRCFAQIKKELKSK